MGDIIDIKSFKKKRSILTLPFTKKKQITIDVNELDFDKENYKSCATCRHYIQDKVYGRRCMVYPDGNFHQITTEVCNPYNDKMLWYPSNTRKHEVGISAGSSYELIFEAFKKAKVHDDENYVLALVPDLIKDTHFLKAFKKEINDNAILQHLSDYMLERYESFES